jgi:hypothetical protein
VEGIRIFEGFLSTGLAGLEIFYGGNSHFEGFLSIGLAGLEIFCGGDSHSLGFMRVGLAGSRLRDTAEVIRRLRDFLI